MELVDIWQWSRIIFCTLGNRCKKLYTTYFKLEFCMCKSCCSNMAVLGGYVSIIVISGSLNMFKCTASLFVVCCYIPPSCHNYGRHFCMQVCLWLSNMLNCTCKLFHVGKIALPMVSNYICISFYVCHLPIISICFAYLWRKTCNSLPFLICSFYRRKLWLVD